MEESRRSQQREALSILLYMFAFCAVVCSFILLCIGNAFTQTSAQKGASCQTANCNAISAPSGDCNINGATDLTCVFSMSTGNITYCSKDPILSCQIIIPPKSQSCTGYCFQNPAFGCTTMFNKCQ
jgi:hypothetical protein